VIYDCFPYFNEEEILRMRLEELLPVVDFFVLVEASRTHTGQPKPYYFEESKAKFKDYLHKIIHYKVDLFDDPGVRPHQNWGREIVQRAHIVEALKERGVMGYPVLDPDVIISTDVDEIPSAQAVYEYSRTWLDIRCLSMKQYQYNLNCQLVENTLDPKICRYRELRIYSPSDLRYMNQKLKLPVMENAGWHLSFMGGTDKIIEKMKSYAHYDPRDPKMDAYMSRENVEACAREGKSLFMRDDVKYNKVKYNTAKDFADFPRTIRAEWRAFAKMGWVTLG